MLSDLYRAERHVLSQSVNSHTIQYWCRPDYPSGFGTAHREGLPTQAKVPGLVQLVRCGSRRFAEMGAAPWHKVCAIEAKVGFLLKLGHE